MSHAATRASRTSRTPGASRAPAAAPWATGAPGAAQAAEAPSGRVRLAPWWERFPGLLEAELAALDTAGIGWELDEEARTRRGVIRLCLHVVVDDEQLELVATFPDLYPFFRFEVQSPTLLLPRHQHPFGRTLCLIGRRSDNWSTRDTLADFLRDRLPTTIATALDPSTETAAADEEHQGEPFTDYYTYEPQTALIVDAKWHVDAPGGELTVGLPPGTPPDQPLLIRGAVLSVRDQQRQEIATADPRLARLFTHHITARWVRLQEPPAQDGGAAALGEIIKADPNLSRPLWQRVAGSTSVDITAAIFPEELTWRATGDAWLFVVRQPGGLARAASR
jgi:hypothetical protein